VTEVHGPDATTVELPSLGAPAARIQSTMRQMLRDATLGEYEILSELGRGGMATVFLAHDISLDRRVAIKVMAPHLLEGEGMADRFKLEARTAAQLSHPHIIPIYAVKETASSLFFIMKFVEGKPLDDIIKKIGQLPIPMVKDILTKVGSALGYAHRRGVVHRDVKPANVMIDEEGTPIVTDFGIAKVAEAKGLTMTGTTIGTPSYMSPEQCEAREVTGASDQYSLGVVAWEMLTGTPPFGGDSAVTIMYKHCHEPLPPLSDFRPDCPAEVMDTVTRMLAKAPSERWPSLEAAIRKLGSSTQDQLDPIRRELLELAKEADPRELIAQLSTPRSPVPSVRTAARADPSSGSRAAATLPVRTRRSWFPLAAASAVLVAAAGGALAVLQPWDSGAPAMGVEGGAPSLPADGAPPGGTSAGPEVGAAGEVVDGGQRGDTEPAAGGQATAGQTTAGGDTPPADGTAAGGGSPPGGRAAGAGAAGASTVAGRGAAPSPPAVVTSVRIDGAQPGLEPGDRVTLSARALGAGGASVQGGQARWSTSDASIGTINQNGQFVAVRPGSVTVSAVIDNVSGSATIDVGAESVASVTVQPSSLTLAPGERVRLTAEPRSQGGAVVRATLTWESNAPGVVTVTGSGDVQAVGPGAAAITVTAQGGPYQIVGVTVTAPPVDTRTAIAEAIGTFARALESRDMAAVRRAFPGMTQEQERGFAGSITSMQRATLDVGQIEESGDVATASVSGEYAFVEGGRRYATPVTFRATFERQGGAWRFMRMQ